MPASAPVPRATGQRPPSPWQVQAARDISGPLPRVGTGPRPQPRREPDGPARPPRPPRPPRPAPRDPPEPRLPWEAEDSPWDDGALDRQRGEETLRRLRAESARGEDPGPSPVRRAVAAVLAAMRARNWLTGLVIPMVSAVTVGIAVVLVAGANGNGGAAPPTGSAGFPPARDASADFTGSSARVVAVASSGGGEVAAGSTAGAPAAWISADGGSTWTRAAGVTAGSGRGELASVTHGSAGWLAVGGSARGQSTPGQQRQSSSPGAVGGPPLVEGSASGRTWSAENGESAFAEDGLVTSATAAGPDGYVIVGRQSVNGRNTAAAWYSRSLTGWQKGTDAQAGALEGTGDRQMNAVTATEHGFSAVGSDGNRPAAWRSADGRTWSEKTLPLPSGATRATLGYVAASGANVTAAGTATTSASQPVPFTEVSADGGESWSLVVLPLPQGGGAADVTALTAAGGGFTATGTYGHAVVVWTTGGNPRAWTESTPDVRGLSGPGTQEITALASSGTTLTGVGFSATASAESPTLWQAPVRG